MKTPHAKAEKLPFLTDYVNAVFIAEQNRLDYVYLKPPLLVVYFVLRLVLLPIKFVIHRKPLGFEHKFIDAVIAFGIKRLAAHDALELLIRHVQIEPLLYRYILSGTAERRNRNHQKLKGIDGDFSILAVEDVVAHGLTICHDDLSYEVMQRFNKDEFLSNLEFYRNTSPEDIAQFDNSVLEDNRKHSLQWLGCTNVIIFIVLTITLFGDLQTAMRALNSFKSDSLALWCAKHICANQPRALINLEFYLPTNGNRSHYSNNPLFADPSHYLYDHIAFDEYLYQLLRTKEES